LFQTVLALRSAGRAAGANSKAQNWQQNVEGQEVACVDQEQNETSRHKKSWM
jgi:hypothetical protein